MSVYKATGPFILEVSALPSAVPVYEGQRAAIQVSITLAAHPNLTLGTFYIKRIFLLNGSLGNNQNSNGDMSFKTGGICGP